MDEHFGNWDEIRTAWTVARLGSLSAASEALGVHRATILRHINALENRLEVRLFQRHPKGYTTTDAGRTLLQVATATAEQFDLLPYRLRSPDAAISGKLVITTLPELAEGLVPLIGRFHQDHPDIQIELLVGSRRLRLEYGEAHIAIRCGPAPKEPDNIARPLGHVSITLYANADYIARFGQPARRDDIAGHQYLSLLRADPHNLPMVWIDKNVPQDQIKFRGGEIQSLRTAAISGMGITPLASWKLRREPDLVELFPPPEDWNTLLWLVTHRDNHRNPKVQAIHSFIQKEFSKES